MTTSETRNEAALASAIERWNAGDLEGYLQIYADDLRMHGVGPAPLDKAGTRAFYEGLVAALPHSRIELHDTFGADDRLVRRRAATVLTRRAVRAGTRRRSSRPDAPLVHPTVRRVGT